MPADIVPVCASVWAVADWQARWNLCNEHDRSQAEAHEDIARSEKASAAANKLLKRM
jgi:hypothetical protein